MIYSRDQILAFAPDAETKRRAFGFSRPRQWIELEGNENILWGTCKTYNRKYQTWVSLAEKKFKCSCKQAMPCRHALGLLLVYIQQSDSFRVTYDIPEKIQDWLAGKIAPKKEIDPEKEAQNRLIRLRNWEKRMQSMAAGLDELEIWLHDLVRQGLAELETQPPEFWAAIATRMVDTKLGSIARRIRLMPELIATQENWHEIILSQLGELYLILKGFRNMEKLPDNLQKEMLNLAGVNYKKDEILQQKGLLDNWIILGQSTKVEENLKARRTWLLGENTKQWALFLDFAWGKQEFEHDWKVGSLVQSELAFYPSAFPLRALAKNYEYLPRDLEQLPAYPNFSAFMTAYSKALADNPWIQQFPLCVKEVIPFLEEDKLMLIDLEKNTIPIHCTERSKWKLLAISGQQTIRIFGEWVNNTLHPMSAFVEERLIVF